MSNIEYGYIEAGTGDKCHAVFNYWVPECCRNGISELFKDPYNRFEIKWVNDNDVLVNVPITRLKTINNFVFDSLARVMAEIGNDYTDDIKITISGNGNFRRYHPQGRPKKYKTLEEKASAQLKFSENYRAKRNKLVQSLTDLKNESIVKPSTDSSE